MPSDPVFTRYVPADHYDEVVRIWKVRGWLPCPQEYLPDDGFVAVSVENNSIMAALFVYIVPGKVGWVDWAVADPGVSRELRALLLPGLFRLCEMTARNAGATFLYATTKVSRFAALLTDEGMQIAERETMTFCKPLLRTEEDMAFISDDKDEDPPAASRGV